MQSEMFLQTSAFLKPDTVFLYFLYNFSKMALFKVLWFTYKQMQKNTKWKQILLLFGMSICCKVAIPVVEKNPINQILFTMNTPNFQTFFSGYL